MVAGKRYSKMVSDKVVGVVYFKYEIIYRFGETSDVTDAMALFRFSINTSNNIWRLV